MSNLIKHLASKMSKLELENRAIARPTQNEGNRNQAPFRRPFQPQQIMQRPRRNPHDQNVQPPLNNFAGENQQEDEENHDINLIEGPSKDTYLTLSVYEDQLMINIFSDNEEGDVLVQDDKRQSETQTRSMI